jgi:hypothetical protein
VRVVLRCCPLPGAGPRPEFRFLTEQVVERFPGHPPYGGVHDDVIRDLTVGESRVGTVGNLKVAEREISRTLPINAHIDVDVPCPKPSRRDPIGWIWPERGMTGRCWRAVTTASPDRTGGPTDLPTISSA